MSQSPVRRPIIALVIIIIIGAIGSIVYFYRQISNPAAQHYQRGMEFASAQKFNDAEREWKAGIAADPNAPECYEALGNLYVALQQYPAAVDCYQQAVKHDPNNGDLMLELAQNQQKMGKLKDAEASAREASRFLPDNADAFGIYGLLAAKAKEPTALAALKRAHELRPDAENYTLGLVYQEMDSQDMAAAKKDLLELLKVHPDSAEACYLMAVIEEQKPDGVPSAIEYAQRALPHMQKDTRIYPMLGKLYLRAQRPQDALNAYTIAYHLTPNSEAVLHGLIDASTRLGKTADAEAYAAKAQQATARHDRIDHLKQVMGFNNQDITSGLELARLVEEDGDLQKAFGYYMQLHKQAPNDPRTRPALAAFLRRIGKPDMAAQVMKAK